MMFKVGLTIGTMFVAVAMTGCGSEKPVADANTLTPPAAATAQTTAQAEQNSPTAVVSEFLDRVRRGGAAQVEASRLLTTRAQAECQRTGLKMGSMGSPDARFEVTRSEQVPNEDNAALVHSLWIEPGSEGEEATYQVVWAMQNEASGWRISGLVMELEPGTDPIVIDFENGEQAAATLGISATNGAATNGAAATQAAAPTDPATTRQ